MNGHLYHNYIDFIMRLDSLCIQIGHELQDHMQCRRGCTACCIAGISLMPVEAYYIAEHIPKEKKTECAPSTSCIFLNRGLCSIYAYRPVLCRTQGYPLVYHSGAGEGYELSHCELNFHAMNRFENSHLIDMDRVNLSLSAVNMRFLEEAGLQKQYGTQRISMGSTPALSL